MLALVHVLYTYHAAGEYTRKILMLTTPKWVSVDLESDLVTLEPPGGLLVGKVTPSELRYYSVRRRVDGITVNLYTRKRSREKVTYGFSMTPEQAMKLAEKLREVTAIVLRQQGRAEIC